jgi:hypothetical protein
VCVPQNDLRDTLDSQKLEATFCRDFECCGLVLSDLHDLLQHYEEYHVCLEEDNETLFESESGNMWSPAHSFSSTSNESLPNNHGLNEDTSPYGFETQENNLDFYLTDLDNGYCVTPTKYLPIINESSIEYDDHTSKNKILKKRSYNKHVGSTPNALDLLAQSAAKKLALTYSMGGDCDLALTDKDFIAQAAQLLATISTGK